MTAALIHPDGRLVALQGEFKSDPTSIAALGHAVHAAGNELAIRTGTGPVYSTTLRGPKTCLTLLPLTDGVLVLEHEEAVPMQTLQAQAAVLLNRHASAPAPAAPAPFSGTMSLADALHATAP